MGMGTVRVERLWVDNVEVDRANVHRAVLAVEVEQIEVSGMTGPDPAWSAVDPAGHWHGAAFNGEKVTYPTLRECDREALCEECLGHGTECAHDGCVGGCADCETCRGAGTVTVTYLGCAICKAEMTPGIVTDPGRSYAPGHMTWWVEVEGAADAWGLGDDRPVIVRVLVTGERARRLYFGVARMTARSVAARIDAAPIMTVRLEGAGELGQRVG
jgi:hypothetical protein